MYAGVQKLENKGIKPFLTASPASIGGMGEMQPGESHHFHTDARQDQETAAQAETEARSGDKEETFPHEDNPAERLGLRPLGFPVPMG